MRPDPLTRLTLALRMARERVLVLVKVADASALTPIWKVVREDQPDAQFCPDAAAALALPPGSTAVMWLRRAEMGGLNLARELFRERSLRLVIVATPEVADAFRDEAPDLYDWTAHRLDVSDDPPWWVVDNIRAVLALEGRVSWWGPGPVDGALSRARPGWAIHRADATGSWNALLEAARVPGWRIWEGAKFAWHEARVRWAEATCGADGAAVLDRPGKDLPGWWRVHGEVVEFDAVGEAGIEAGFEPEALGRRASVLPEPEWATGIRREMGPELRAVKPGMDALAQEASEELARGGWPSFATLPAFGSSSGEVSADALGRLAEHPRSFLVERAIRGGVALRERIEVAIDTGHLDVATDWLSSLEARDPVERGWRKLLEILVVEGEAVDTQQGALEELLVEARETGDASLEAAVQYRLGQARFDDMDLARARAEVRAAIEREPAAWRKLEMGLLDLQITERLGPVPEVLEGARRLKDAADEIEDVMRAALVQDKLGRPLILLGQRARYSSIDQVVQHMHQSSIHEGAGDFATRHLRISDLMGAAHRQGRAARLSQLIREQWELSVEQGNLDIEFGQVSGLSRHTRLAIVEASLVLSKADTPLDVAIGGVASIDVENSPVSAMSDIRQCGVQLALEHRVGAQRYARRAREIAVRRGEVVPQIWALLTLAAIRTAMGTAIMDEAWALCRNTTDPELRASVLETTVSLPPWPPNLPTMFAETLDYAARYPDEESAWVPTRIRKLLADTLADVRKQLHRARSQRDQPTIKRLEKLEKRLAAIPA